MGLPFPMNWSSCKATFMSFVVISLSGSFSVNISQRYSMTALFNNPERTHSDMTLPKLESDEMLIEFNNFDNPETTFTAYSLKNINYFIHNSTA